MDHPPANLAIRLPDFLPEYLAIFALLSSGPFSYFHVQKTVRPVYRFGRKDFLHLPGFSGISRVSNTFGAEHYYDGVCIYPA